MKQISCGVVIQNKEKQILGLQAYGKYGLNTLDIPKGLMREDEKYIQCAIRETYEETNLILPAVSDNMFDTGMWLYTKNKNLYLYYYRTNFIDISKLKCNSYFPIKSGIMVPEVSGYEWVDIENIDTKFFRGLCPIIHKIISKEY